MEYIYPFLREKTNIASNENYLCKDKLSVRKYTKCIGLPFKQLYSENHLLVDGGGLECNGRIVENSSIARYFTMGYEYNSDMLDHVSDVIFYGHICTDCWGHAITDSLAHAWWFQTDEYKNSYSHLPIYYWGVKPLKGNYLELIKMAGVPVEKLIFLERPTYFESAIVPDDCFNQYKVGKRCYYNEYTCLVDAICNNSKKAPVKTNVWHKKLYQARRNDSRLYISPAIIKLLEQRGYVSVYPENYSFAEQVQMLQYADEVVSEESSLSHNLVFCKPGTKVYILRKANYVNTFQTLINQMRDLDVTYIDCHLSVLTRSVLPSEGPFFMYANDLFCKCFGMAYKGFPYKEFRKWLNYHNWFTEDTTTRANRLVWDENHAEIFARELQWTKEQAEKKYAWIMKLPFVPKKIRERGFTWMVKKYMRNLM